MTQPAAALRAWVITIPWDAGLTTKNQKMSPMKRYRLTQLAQTTAYGAWCAAGRPRASGKVRLSITVRRARALDEANVMSGLDGLIDGIFSAHRVRGYSVERGCMTVDDSPQYLELGEVRQEIEPKWKANEQVIFTITEVE